MLVRQEATQQYKYIRAEYPHEYHKTDTKCFVGVENMDRGPHLLKAKTETLWGWTFALLHHCKEHTESQYPEWRRSVTPQR